ncbi:GAF domain-containing protein [Lusitaniella coriacea]|uniref:GAF domain-containing protein n=1 Tax=Lusitaniella coriacea TaxID=1983105 RepID=UPI003CF66339
MMIWETFPTLFAPTQFIPSNCGYFGQTSFITLSIIGDSLLAAVYFCIPAILAYCTCQRRDIPFVRTFHLFGIFLLFCGVSNLLDIWTLWHPIGWIAAVEKAIAAVLGCLTTIQIRRRLPQFFTLRMPRELETINQELQTQIAERQKAEYTLQRLVSGTASVTGKEFFFALVENLAEVLDARYAFVAEVTRDRPKTLKTLACWAGTRLDKCFEYEVENSPQEIVIDRAKFCYLPHAVQKRLIPDAEKASGSKGYFLGAPLLDKNQQVIGTLCINSDRAIANEEQAKAILSLFAARATAELERQRAQFALRQAHQDLELKTQQLHRAYSDLEQQVNEATQGLRQRTAELLRANAALEKEIQERIAAESALRDSGIRLGRQQRGLLELAKSQNLYQGNLSAAFGEMTELACRTLSVERGSVWFYNSERSEIRCADLYDLSSKCHEKGAKLSVADYPTYFQALEVNRAIAARDAYSDPRTTEFSSSYLEPFNITSMLDVPVRVQGRIVGVICLEHTGNKRSWAIEEQNFASYLAYAVALAIEARDRRQAEIALRESEERWQLAVQGSNQGIWDWNLQTHSTVISDRLAAILGYDTSEIPDERHWWTARIHPGDYAAVINAQQQHLERKTPYYRAEYRLRGKDGTYCWILDRGQALWDANGQPIRMVGSYTDIGDRKQAELALRQQVAIDSLLSQISRKLIDQNLNTAIDFALKGIGKITRCDRCYILHYFEAENLLSNTYEWCAPGIPSLHEERQEIGANAFPSFLQFRQSGKVVKVSRLEDLPLHTIAEKAELERQSIQSLLLVPTIHSDTVFGFIGLDAVRAPKDWKPEEVNLLKRVGELIAIARSRHEAQEALQARNQELATTLQQLETTQDELIQSEKMAALGQLIAGVAHEINTPLGAIRSSISNIAEFLDRYLHRLPDFFRQLSPENYAHFSELLRLSNPHVMLLPSREKRQYKRALKRKLEAQGLAKAGAIADTLVDMGIYRDISAFESWLHQPDSREILKMAYQLVGLQDSTQNTIAAIDRAATVVFALKSYARSDRLGEKVPANLTDGIETVLTLYCTQIKRGVTLRRNYSKLPLIPCYPDELNQVWTNLIHNALQAMDYQGVLTIDAFQQHDNICISITDSGMGIALDIQPQIFQPFFTTKPPGEGSGLGLDIVQKIVRKHEGTIEFDSIPGKTTFTISLPIESAMSQDKTNQPPLQPVQSEV